MFLTSSGHFSLRKSTYVFLLFFSCIAYAGKKGLDSEQKKAQTRPPVQFNQEEASGTTTPEKKEKEIQPLEAKNGNAYLKLEPLGLNLFANILSFLDPKSIIHFSSTCSTIRKKTLNAPIPDDFLNSVKETIQSGSRGFFWNTPLKEIFVTEFPVFDCYSFEKGLQKTQAPLSKISLQHTSPPLSISYFDDRILNERYPDWKTSVQAAQIPIVTEDLSLLSKGSGLSSQVVRIYLDLYLTNDNYVRTIWEQPHNMPHPEEKTLSWILPIILENKIEVTLSDFYLRPQYKESDKFLKPLFATGKVSELESSGLLFQDEKLDLSSLRLVLLKPKRFSDLTAFSLSKRAPNIQILVLDCEDTTHFNHEELAKLELLKLSKLEEITCIFPTMSDKIFDVFYKKLPSQIKRLCFVEHPLNVSQLKALCDQLTSLHFLFYLPVITENVGLADHITMLKKHKNLLYLSMSFREKAFNDSSNLKLDRSLEKEKNLFPYLGLLDIDATDLSLKKKAALFRSFLSNLSAFGLSKEEEEAEKGAPLKYVTLTDVPPYDTSFVVDFLKKTASNVRLKVDPDLLEVIQNIIPQKDSRLMVSKESSDEDRPLKKERFQALRAQNVLSDFDQAPEEDSENEEDDDNSQDAIGEPVLNANPINELQVNDVVNNQDAANVDEVLNQNLLADLPEEEADHADSKGEKSDEASEKNEDGEKAPSYHADDEKDDAQPANEEVVLIKNLKLKKPNSKDLKKKAAGVKSSKAKKPASKSLMTKVEKLRKLTKQTAAVQAQKIKKAEKLEKVRKPRAKTEKAAEVKVRKPKKTVLKTSAVKLEKVKKPQNKKSKDKNKAK